MDVRNEKNRRSRSHADNLSLDLNCRTVLESHVDISFVPLSSWITQAIPFAIRSAAF